MKIYKIAFRNFLDLVANRFSTQILYYLKNKYLKVPKVNVVNFQENIKEFDNSSITSVTQFYPIKEKIFPSLQIKGGYKFTSSLDTFSLLIIIGTNFSLKDLDDVYVMIVRSIRHELSHIKQRRDRLEFQKDYDPSKLSSGTVVKIYNERLKYLNSSMEKEPFISALMMIAKKRKRPIKELIDEFIFSQLYGTKNNEIYIKKNIKNAENIEIKLKKDYYKVVENIFHEIIK